MIARGEVIAPRLAGGQTNIVLFQQDTSISPNADRLDTPTLALLTPNRLKLEEMGRRVGRIHTYMVGSGVCFAVAPGLLLTCRHTARSAVVAPRSISTGVFSFHTEAIKTPVAISEVVVDQTYLDGVAVPFREPMNPAQNTDFADFDLCLYELPASPWHTLFPGDWSPLFPATTIPNVGQKIVVIHYPADPAHSVEYSIRHPITNVESRRNMATLLSEIFEVPGFKMLSFGDRLAILTPDDEILCYDAQVISGSSGGALVDANGPANTFFGVHIGGEPYSDHRFPFGWNHGYSVNHPAFVLLYLRYVIPRWGQPVPNEVVAYVRLHHNLINQHTVWLNAVDVGTVARLLAL